MAGSDFIPFASEQLDGVIDYAAWRRMLRSISSLKAEVGTVKELEARANDTYKLADPSAEAAIMADAWDCVATTVRDIMADGIATSKTEYWVGLADAVRCVTRLTAAPEYGRGTGATARDMVLAMSFILDMSFRNADPKLRESAVPPADGRRQKARIASVYVDLMVGRGPAWTCACLLNAAVAGVARHEDAVSMDAAWRVTRTADVINRCTSQTGLNRDVAAGQMLVNMLGAMFVCDQRQTDAYAREGRQDANVASCLRQESLAPCGSAVIAMCQHMGRLDASCRGYIAALNVSPTELCLSADAEYDQALRQGNVQMITNAQAADEARSIDSGNAAK